SLGFLLSTHPTGRSVRDHHRQGLSAAPAQAWGVASPARTVAPDHSGRARGAALDPPLGVVPAGLQATGARRVRIVEHPQLPGRLGTVGDASGPRGTRPDPI